ncbi:MAG: cell division protein FtsW, partial [Candidatus Krumholzibacteria bacterium]|nr:cell division protein FtsW [Candidatus Krumholzibacteria bacterium]
MSRKAKYDLKLFYIAIFLVVLGLIMVTSATQIIAQERMKSPFGFFQRQALRVALGLCVLLIFMKIPFRIYQRFSVPILLSSVFLLAAIFFWGREIRGANRTLPVFNFMLHPVEAAKLSLVIFLAAKIADWRGRIRNFRRGFLPLAGVAAVMAVMIAMQPNISNASLIIMISFVILFIGGCRLGHLALFGTAITAAAIPVVYRYSHVYGRISALLNRGEDLDGLNWQVQQSLIALGSGFIFGCGPGRGHQKYSFLPDAHTDFIYSIIGEELGAVGTVVVLVLFAFILRRAIRTARRAPNSFGYLLALGIGITIFATAAINIAMTLGILPTAGLPLPFISYGGSSLVASLAAVGILLNISSEGQEKNRPTEHVS